MVVFHFPLIKQNWSGWSGSRLWTMGAAPVPDMLGGREQSVWFRFLQLRCEGEELQPPCAVHGKPQYWDSFWSVRPLMSMHASYFETPGRGTHLALRERQPYKAAGRFGPFMCGVRLGARLSS